MKLDERETILHLPEDGSEASIYTHRKALWKRCEKAGWKLNLSDKGGREYCGPVSEVNISVRTRIKRRAQPASEAQKAARARFASRARKSTKD